MPIEELPVWPTKPVELETYGLLKEIIEDCKYIVTGSIFYRSNLCIRIGNRVYNISCFRGQPCRE